MLYMLTPALAALDETLIWTYVGLPYMFDDVLAASLGVGDTQPSAIPPCRLSNVRFLEHTIGGASIAAHLSNVRFLYRAYDRRSIHRCQPT